MCVSTATLPRHGSAHLAAVTHDAGEAAREEHHVQQRLEGVAVQVSDGEGELLHVLRDALIRVCQPWRVATSCREILPQQLARTGRFRCCSSCSVLADTVGVRLQGVMFACCPRASTRGAVLAHDSSRCIFRKVKMKISSDKHVGGTDAERTFHGVRFALMAVCCTHANA